MVQEIASRRRKGEGDEGQASSSRSNRQQTSASAGAGSSVRRSSRPPARPSFVVLVAIAFVGFCLVNVRLVSRLEEGGSGGVPSSHSSSSRGGDATGDEIAPTPSAARDRDVNDDRVLTHFRRAGVDLDAASMRRLPTWSEIESLIGTEAVVLGLDRCEVFREKVPPLRRMLGSAGMFNSGTNLVTSLMKANCVIPERFEKYGPNATKEQYGIRWQCPWGKHTPVQLRHDHLAPKAKDQNADDCLPIVTVRNPFTWMKSMCKLPYSATWDRRDGGAGRKDVCPHLVYADSPSGVRMPVRLEFKFSGHSLSYDSLAHLWNEWYAGYWRNADGFPFLMVRLEDLVFRQYETTRIICECAGGTVAPEDDFKFIVNSAKIGPAHGKKAERTDMVDAWVKYGKPMAARAEFSDLDYDAAMEFLSRELMEKMGYKYPPSK